MDFHEVRREMFRLYHAGDLAAARDLVEDHAAAFPDRAAHVAFWRMCLHSRTGRPERAIELFRDALDEGLWYADAMLADQDLDAARILPAWRPLAEKSLGRAVAAGEAVVPTPVVTRPQRESETTLAVLHGMDGNPADTAADWEPARAAGCVVVSLQATLQFAPGAFAWDLDRGPQSALDQIEGAGVEGRLILGGFSQGAGLAGHLAWTGLVATGGLILVAPTLRFWGMPIAVGRTRRVPTYIVAGGRDQRAGELREFRDYCDRSGMPVRLEEHAELGHDYPPDFGSVLERALGWIEEF